MAWLWQIVCWCVWLWMRRRLGGHQAVRVRQWCQALYELCPVCGTCDWTRDAWMGRGVRVW
jgi:hypothetical protein